MHSALELRIDIVCLKCHLFGCFWKSKLKIDFNAIQSARLPPPASRLPPRRSFSSLHRPSVSLCIIPPAPRPTTHLPPRRPPTPPPTVYLPPHWPISFLADAPEQKKKEVVGRPTRRGAAPPLTCLPHGEPLRLLSCLPLWDWWRRGSG